MLTKKKVFCWKFVWLFCSKLYYWIRPIFHSFNSHHRNFFEFKYLHDSNVFISKRIHTPKKNAQTHRKITIRTKKMLQAFIKLLFYFEFQSECMSMKSIKYALNIDRKFVIVAYVVTSLPKIDILLSLLIAKPYSTVEKKSNQFNRTCKLVYRQIELRELTIRWCWLWQRQKK